MTISTNKRGSVRSLESVVNNGKKLVVYYHDNLEILSLLCAGLEAGKMNNAEILQCTEECSNYECSTYVTRREIDEFLELYHMYDFSDRVLVISDYDQYGSLFNYVKNGILTKQEMVDALLSQI